MEFEYYGNQLDPSKFLARTHKYIYDKTGILTTVLLTSEALTLRGTEMYFAIMRLMGTCTGGSLGLADFRIALYTSTSDRYQACSLGGTNDRVNGSCMFGTASRPAVLPVPIVIPGSGAILMDIENSSGSTIALHLVFEGVRLFPK
jgi:hypothetical protein